jgi:hypothetical protein
MRLESGYGTEQFNELIEIVLIRLAEQVHVLPATRGENHSESAGLLRLAIEAGSLAFRRAEGQFLSGRLGTDVRNRERDRIWRYAAFLGALLRPVGRCCTAVGVSTSSTRQSWNPYQEGLWTWIARSNAHELDVKWRERSDGHPEQASSVWIAARLLPPSSLSYLSSTDDPVLEAISQMLIGARAGRACEIVAEAVQAAVDRDLVRLGRQREAGSSGIALEHRILDAIRILIREKWTLNTPGSRLFVARQGVFLAWKAAVTDIAVKLRVDGVGPAPRDPDTLAEILLARGFLVPNTEAAGVLKHYHRIVPQLRGTPKQPIEAVKFTDAELVGLSLDGVEAIDVELAGGLPPTVGSLPSKVVARPAPARSSRTASGSGSKPGAGNGNLDLPFQSGPSVPDRRPDSTPESTASSALVIDAPAGDAATQIASSSDASHSAAVVVRAEDGSGSGNPTSTKVGSTESRETDTAESDAALARLAQFGPAGPVLRALGERLIAQPRLPGVISTPEGVALSYPHAIAQFCPEPQRFLAACESQGLLVADKAAGGRLVRQRGADRAMPEHYIVLSQRVARYLPAPPREAIDVATS